MSSRAVIAVALSAVVAAALLVGAGVASASVKVHPARTFSLDSVYLVTGASFSADPIACNSGDVMLSATTVYGHSIGYDVDGGGTPIGAHYGASTGSNDLAIICAVVS